MRRRHRREAPSGGRRLRTAVPPFGLGRTPVAVMPSWEAASCADRGAGAHADGAESPTALRGDSHRTPELSARTATRQATSPEQARTPYATGATPPREGEGRGDRGVRCSG